MYLYWDAIRVVVKYYRDAIRMKKGFWDVIRSHRLKYRSARSFRLNMLLLSIASLNLATNIVIESNQLPTPSSLR